MQRKTEELQLAVQEYLDVDWTAVKYYLRRQIAKCVQECKSQASNAKRIARSIKHNHNQQIAVPENGAYDSDDSDDWGTDFEDDDEDEVKKEVTELNNNTINNFFTGSIESVSNQPSSNGSTHGKFIPKPPDLPVISSTVNGSNVCRKPQHTNSIPRPPLKRPPSQPPPPPIPKSLSNEKPQEEYEVPIVVQSNVITTTTSDRMFSAFPNASYSSESNHSSIIETYEVIEHVEEDYEIVDAPMMSENTSDKPILPPRVTPSTGLPPPPPLPQKPRKLHDGIQERPEGIRTFSRPKLPAKLEEDNQDNNISTSSGGISATFLTSLLGRRGSSTPLSSPKMQHKVQNCNESVLSNTSTVSSNESHSSRSCSPDREVLSVATSAFTLSGSPSEVKKPLLPPPPLPPRGALSLDDTAQNMATRPLPPVPLPKQEDKSFSKSDDVSQCPWFHEIEREEAERVVRGLLVSGSFLVRPSKRAGAANPYSLTIFNEGRVFHLNIRLRSDQTFALGKEKENEKTFKCVADLIGYHQTEGILLTSRGQPVGTTILSRYPEKKSI